MDGVWIAILANLCFVISNVIFRKSENESSPAFINLTRTFIGVISFIIISIISQTFRYIFEISWILWIWLILSFVFGQVIGDTSFLIAQKKLGTTQALAISMTFPVITYLFSMIFLGEQFNFLILISFGLILCGVLIINHESEKNKEKVEFNNQQEFTKNEMDDQIKLKKKFAPSAIIFGLIASLGWASGLVIIDYATKQLDNQFGGELSSSLLGNVIRFPFAFLFLIGVTYQFDKEISLKKGWKTWVWLILGSLIGTTLGAHFYTEAARTAGATIMSLIASASPLFALPIGFLVNKEKITWKSFIGVIFTITGVLLIILF